MPPRISAKKHQKHDIFWNASCHNWRKRLKFYSLFIFQCVHSYHGQLVENFQKEINSKCFLKGRSKSWSWNVFGWCSVDTFQCLVLFLWLWMRAVRARVFIVNLQFAFQLTLSLVLFHFTFFDAQWIYILWFSWSLQNRTSQCVLFFQHSLVVKERHKITKKNFIFKSDARSPNLTNRVLWFRIRYNHLREIERVWYNFVCYLTTSMLVMCTYVFYVQTSFATHVHVFVWHQFEFCFPRTCQYYTPEINKCIVLVSCHIFQTREKSPSCRGELFQHTANVRHGWKFTSWQWSPSIHNLFGCLSDKDHLVRIKCSAYRWPSKSNGPSCDPPSKSPWKENQTHTREKTSSKSQNQSLVEFAKIMDHKAREDELCLEIKFQENEKNTQLVFLACDFSSASSSLWTSKGRQASENENLRGEYHSGCSDHVGYFSLGQTLHRKMCGSKSRIIFVRGARRICCDWRRDPLIQ